MERDCYLGNLPMHRILELFELMAPDLPLPMTFEDEGFEPREDEARGMLFDYVDSNDRRWTFGHWSEAVAFRNALWFSHQAGNAMTTERQRLIGEHYNVLIMPDV